MPAPGGAVVQQAPAGATLGRSSYSDRDSVGNATQTENTGNDNYERNGHSDRAIEAVCGQLALSRLPISQPEIFDGKDPLSYPIWKLSFDALINHQAMTATDKLTLLRFKV